MSAALYIRYAGTKNVMHERVELKCTCLIKLSVPREKTITWQTRCRQQAGKCEFCDQSTPELILDRFIVGINNRTLITKPQNGSQRPFIFFIKGRMRPFLMTENYVWSHFSPFQINIRNFYFWYFFSQNGHRRPFWYFRSHFSPFEINTQLL